MQAGLFVGPFWGVYSTSKFAVVGMMEALRSELSNTNIGVSVFCPGNVKSNIPSSARNRPPEFAETGAPDSHTSALAEQFYRQVQTAVESNSEWPMDPDEAGWRVLRGIRNNDLYIISHPEYAQAIRDRQDAILASIPNESTPTSVERTAIAKIFSKSIYSNELDRRMRP